MRYRFTFARLVVSLLVATLVTLLAQRINIINSFEYWTGDWRTALLSHASTKPNDDVALVLIDEETIERFGSEYRSPTDRALLAALIRSIDNARPKAIGLDFIFDQKTTNDPIFLDTIRHAKAPVVLGEAAPPIKLSPMQSAFQAAFLKETGRSFGYLNIATDFDDVVRVQGTLDREREGHLSFAEALAASAGKAVENRPRRISWLRGTSRADAFSTIPAWLLLHSINNQQNGPDKASQLLANRIVVIGLELYGQKDSHWTPLSKWTGEPMIGALIQANLTAQVWDGRNDRDLNIPEKFVFSALVTFLGLLLSYGISQRDWLYKWLALVPYVIADAIAYTQFDIVLPFGIAAVSWLLGIFLGGRFHSFERHRFVSPTVGGIFAKKS